MAPLQQGFTGLLIINDDLRVLTAVLEYANPEGGAPRDTPRLEATLKAVLQNHITGFY